VTFRWTEALAEPVATLARGGDWSRVEESRRGGWLLRSASSDEERCWFHAPGGEERPARLHPFDDVAMPALKPSVEHWSRLGYAVELLAWRVHRRAVFRIVSGTESRICKFYAKDRAVRTRWSVLSRDHGTAWRTPEVLEWDPDRRRLTIESCPGVPLNRLWVSGRGRRQDGDEIADILDWLRVTRVPEDLPCYDAGDEIDLLQKRLTSFERTLREPPPQARELVRLVTSALDEIRGGERRLCHRDFHDKQILLQGTGGTLLDLDLIAAGPPALDAGNILAHLRLRALQGTDLPWHDIADRVVQRTTASLGSDETLRIWTASALLRLALIYSRRRRPAGLLERLLDSTSEALRGGGEWKGLTRAA
jgi:hypothetical protein